VLISILDEELLSRPTWIEMVGVPVEEPVLAPPSRLRPLNSTLLLIRSISLRMSWNSSFSACFESELSRPEVPLC